MPIRACRRCVRSREDAPHRLYVWDAEMTSDGQRFKLFPSWSMEREISVVMQGACRARSSGAVPATSQLEKRYFGYGGSRISRLGRQELAASDHGHDDLSTTAAGRIEAWSLLGWQAANWSVGLQFRQPTTPNGGVSGR